MLTGIALGVMMFGSLYLTFIKLPLFFRKKVLKWGLFTDLAAGTLVFFIVSKISQTLVALIAAILTGLLVGIGLEAVKQTDKDPELAQAVDDIKANGGQFIKNWLAKSIKTLAGFILRRTTPQTNA